MTAISMTHTRVLVNAGDHAQDVTTAVEVGHDECGGQTTIEGDEYGETEICADCGEEVEMIR